GRAFSWAPWGVGSSRFTPLSRLAIVFEVKLIRIRGFKAMAIDATRVQTIEEIDPFEAAEEINGGDVVLIDTREPHEYQEAHLENGKLVAPGLLADEIATAAPDKSARTILYCRSGYRSALAAAQLQQLGYENVASMSGGILQWQAAGLAVVVG